VCVETAPEGFYGQPGGCRLFPRMQSAASATCELCGREIVADRAEHYRRHLENAQAL
jgi:hypothetical protein